jgi:Adenylate and Guanylate cyclase catalytic domain
MLHFSFQLLLVSFGVKEVGFSSQSAYRFFREIYLLLVAAAPNLAIFFTDAVGDTMKTTARMEQNGLPGKIHLSEATANLLMAAGKGKWITPREDKIDAKGLGRLTVNTFWLSPQLQFVFTQLYITLTLPSRVTYPISIYSKVTVYLPVNSKVKANGKSGTNLYFRE